MIRIIFTGFAMIILRQPSKLREFAKFSLAPMGVWRFFICFLLMIFFLFDFSLSGRSAVDDLKNNLQSELDKIQAEIDQYRGKINETQAQQKTLKREVQILDNKIKETGLEIKQAEIILQQTQLGIDQKNGEISKMEEKLSREKNLLAQYLRGIYETDQNSMIGIIFSQKRLSDVFNEINSLETVQQRTYETIAQIKIMKEGLELEKDDLTQKKEDELQLKALLEIQRASARAHQAEKNSLIRQTKGEEANFQKLLQKAKEDVTAIKKQIYMLEGVGLKMTLEEAYHHAKYAADRTGVRPAFLLAVLKQESSWGTNVGTGTWKKDMKLVDQKAFIQITDELNLDPNQMPVSKKPWYGWGGAMGPAQFLPTTWLAYKDAVAKATGHNPPSPWDIDDAFTASAIKLSRDGASAKTQDAEWKAAMVYFAGNNWSKSVYRFYGDSVMELAGVIQEQLDIITR